MASAMSVTCSSSKQRSCASAASARATSGMGSPGVDLRAAAMRSCTSAMNSWKCTRRLGSKATRLEEKIHQHGLAPADGAKNIAPLGRLLRAADEPAQAALARSPALELLRQAIEPRRGRGLRRVGFDHLVADEGAIRLDEIHFVSATATTTEGQGAQVVMRPGMRGSESCPIAEQMTACRTMCRKMRGRAPHVALQHRHQFIVMGRISVHHSAVINSVDCAMRNRAYMEASPRIQRHEERSRRRGEKEEG